MTYLGLLGVTLSYTYYLCCVKDYSRQNTKAFEGINFDLEKLSNT